uniref:Glutaminyl-peptide cyclotransferase n=1 Tax=Leptobrachium leishanense TaxID=445787 RepID=A0A8C5QN65_9ANUR
MLVLGVGVLIGAGVLLWENSAESRSVEEEDVRRGAPREVAAKTLSSSRLRTLASEVNMKHFWRSLLRPMLVERTAGSAGNKLVREHISSHVQSLSAGWTVELDLFDAFTPRGILSFGNVIATLDPDAPRRMVLACHLDSKVIPNDERGRPFIGATDSAVPCSIILEAVTALDARLKQLKERGSQLTLQLFFLDGEEAIAEWTRTDSLYGARHLAQRLERAWMPGTSISQLQAIDVFILLDLLGAPDPVFTSHFSETHEQFLRLRTLEKRLHDLNLLKSHPYENYYFRLYPSSPVEDDHMPFVRRGVPALHIISTPFPAVWHTHEDTEENLHRPTILNLLRILAAFLAETLSL